MKPLLFASGLILLASCSIQRAEIARDAQTEMVGMSRAEVLACMGAPHASAQEGELEVWSYASGGDTRVVGNVYDYGQSSYVGARAITRSCTVNVIMNEGTVEKIEYLGKTGGILSKGEQCAYAVKECLEE